MSGLYIHVPFCRKACIYCDFHFSTSLKYRMEMVKALCKELELQQEFLANNELSTIYFGGGTPSILEKEELELIFDAIHQYYSVKNDAEITLEANPDDLSDKKLINMVSAGVNRLSIGIQSFRDEDLRLMNRSHNARQAEECVRAAQDKGLTNLSLDLIYGTPGMDKGIWEEQIGKAIDLKVPHISSYALTVEPKTALEYKIEKGEIPQISETDSSLQFESLTQLMAQHHYEHYEVSNFALKGYRAQHNSSYWEGKPYLGIGPSAHSYKPGLRQWNIKNNPLYIKALRAGELSFEQEALTEKDRYNEFVMTSLRRVEGLDLEYIEQHFGALFSKFLEQEAQALLHKGHLIKEENALKIPPPWRFHSDGIAAALFYI